jgi:hypothetical protein
LDRLFVAFERFLPPKIDPEIVKIHQKVASETPSKTSLIFDRCLIDLWRPRPSKTCLPLKRDANLHKMVFSRKFKTTSKSLPESFQKRAQNHENCPPEIDRKIDTLQKRFFSKKSFQNELKKICRSPLFRFFFQASFWVSKNQVSEPISQGFGPRFWSFVR